MKLKLLAIAILLTLTLNKIQAQIPSYIPKDSLVGWWPFNGNANDESGNGNHGTVTGAKKSKDRFNNLDAAYNFNANNWNWGSGGDMVKIPYTSKFNSNKLTISVWFKRTSGGLGYNAQDLSLVKRFEYGYSNPSGETFFSTIGNRNSPIGNRLELWLLGKLPNGSKDNIKFQSTDTIGLNNWNQLCFTYDSLTFQIYLNGVKIGSLKSTNGFKINTAGNSGLSIGMGDQANGHWGPYDGLIDDVGFWNRALDSNEIKSIYNGSTANVQNKNSNSKIKVYPNPAKDHLVIDFGNYSSMAGYEINIFDVAGKSVYSSTINKSTETIDLNTWTGKGVYFLKIYDKLNQQIENRKIVIQ